jgi:hypothetical protein
MLIITPATLKEAYLTIIRGQLDVSYRHITIL